MLLGITICFSHIALHIERQWIGKTERGITRLLPKLKKAGDHIVVVVVEFVDEKVLIALCILRFVDLERGLGHRYRASGSDDCLVCVMMMGGSVRMMCRSHSGRKPVVTIASEYLKRPGISSDSKIVGATTGGATDDVPSAAVRGAGEVAIAPVVDGEVQEAELMRPR